MDQKNELHRAIVANLDRVEEWFRANITAIDVPFYSSYDIRDSGFKVVNVDANIYPAGFNNICQVDRENAPPLVRNYIDRHYGDGIQKLLLMTEEHTNNPYYWDNVFSLQEILKGADLEVCVAVPRLYEKTGSEHAVMKAASGREVKVVSANLASHSGTENQGGRPEATAIRCDSFAADLIISNNDFSEYYQEWGARIEQKVNPPRELGWWQRKKSTYFTHYNNLAREFADLLGVDPWLLTVETELLSEFHISELASREILAERAQRLIDRIKENYRMRGIQEEPSVFVKNNSGTYGLAVLRVTSGEEVLALNNRSRTKMKAAKGGRHVEEVIIQEGVPSIVRSEGVTAEPTLYLFGCRLAGGFLRAHSEKGPSESLNSPGAVYKRLCVSDLEVSVEGHPLENVYGWISRLGVLAIGRESKEMAVVYQGYRS